MNVNDGVIRVTKHLITRCNMFSLNDVMVAFEDNQKTKINNKTTTKNCRISFK